MNESRRRDRDDLAERERESEATSSQTLEDVEAEEEGSERTDSPETNVPSPDGALDKKREPVEGGPM